MKGFSLFGTVMLIISFSAPLFAKTVTPHSAIGKEPIDQHVVVDGSGIRLSRLFNQILRDDHDDNDDPTMVARGKHAPLKPEVWTSPASGSFGIKAIISF